MYVNPFSQFLNVVPKSDVYKLTPPQTQPNYWLVVTGRGRRPAAGTEVRLGYGRFRDVIKTFRRRTADRQVYNTDIVRKIIGEL